MFTVNKNPGTGDLRKFGWAMLFGFSATSLFLWVMAWRKYGGHGPLGWSGAGGQIVALCLWGLGAALCSLSLSSLTLARPVYVAWMTVATKLGVVMSTLLLSVLFWLILPLFSVIVRMGDPLRKKLSRNGTYWEPHKAHEATLERMRRPF